MRIFAKWIVCILAVLLVCAIFPNTVYVSNIWLAALTAGTILFIINLTIKPLAQLIALPISCLTLGIGALLVNTLMVWLTDRLLPLVDFRSFWIMLLVAVFVSFGTAVFDSARKD